MVSFKSFIKGKMSVKHLHTIVAACAWIALFTGCAVGPNFHRPAPPGIESYTAEPLTATTSTTNVAGGEQQHFIMGMDISQQWWTLFKSPPLNGLIEKSLKANPTVDAAKAA